MKQFILLLLVGSLLAVQPCEAKKKVVRKKVKTTKVVTEEAKNQEVEPVLQTDIEVQESNETQSNQVACVQKEEESVSGSYSEDKYDNNIFLQVDQVPTYPGGESALLYDIASNLRYPAIAAEQGIEGNCIIQFVVTKTGEVGAYKVAKSLSPDCDREAIRVIKSLPHKFTPGRKDGRDVAVMCTLPITFKLTKGNSKTK